MTEKFEPIGPGSLRRAMHGARGLALVLRPLTYDELVTYAYAGYERGHEPGWMTLHLETGEQIAHGERVLNDRRFWMDPLDG